MFMDATMVLSEVHKMKNMIINRIISVLNDMDLVTLQAVLNVLTRMKGGELWIARKTMN